jgi:hypothetical protein
MDEFEEYAGVSESPSEQFPDIDHETVKRIF